MKARQNAKGLIIRALAELEMLEWEGCDASAMPVCSSCKRDRPDYDARSDLAGRHNADCEWLHLVLDLRQWLTENQ